jgi:hypothetical protein
MEYLIARKGSDLSVRKQDKVELLGLQTLSRDRWTAGRAAATQLLDSFVLFCDSSHTRPAD